MWNAGLISRQCSQIVELFGPHHTVEIEKFQSEWVWCLILADSLRPEVLSETRDSELRAGRAGRAWGEGRASSVLSCSQSFSDSISVSVLSRSCYLEVVGRFTIRLYSCISWVKWNFRLRLLILLLVKIFNVSKRFSVFTYSKNIIANCFNSNFSKMQLFNEHLETVMLDFTPYFCYFLE